MTKTVGYLTTNCDVTGQKTENTSASYKLLLFLIYFICDSSYIAPATF